MSIVRSALLSVILAAAASGCHGGHDQRTTPRAEPTETAALGTDIGNGTDASGSSLDPADSRGGPAPEPTTPDRLPPNSINPTKPPLDNGAYPNRATPIPTPPPTPMANPMPRPSPGPIPVPPPGPMPPPIP